jgi:HlyD family secretion protein
VTAEAAVRAASTRAEEARTERERATTLFGGGAISRQALDRAESAYQVATAALEQAEEQLALVQEGPRTETVRAQTAVVAQARANVARAEARLGNAVVTAPFDGVVTIVHREPGESVTPGAPAITLLAPDDRWVRIYVPEDQMGRVQLGLRAAIVSDTYPDRVYDGEVIFVGSEAEFTPRNVQTAEERTKLVYPVRVRVNDDPGFELKPGIPVDVTLLEPEA